MRSSKPLGLAAMAAAAALTLTACGGGDGGGSETAGGDGGGETVRIGIKFDQPGLGFQDGDQYTGFDVDELFTYDIRNLRLYGRGRG